MKTQLSESASSARDPMDGGAVCAAVFAPDTQSRAPCLVTKPGRSSIVSAAASVLLLGVLAGCGGSASTESASIEEPRSSDSTPDVPAPLAPEPADEDNPTPAVTTTSTSADVLLLLPAGNTELPVGQTPSVQFKKAESSTEESATDDRTSPPLNSFNTDDSAASGNVTVSWDPPTQNADGSRLDDLAGYRVYQGNMQQLSIIQELNETGAGGRRLAQVANVTEANACFAVTAYDTSSNESALGDVICKDVIVAAPPINRSAPTLSSATQLSTADGQASISLVWQPPLESSAGAGATIESYNIFHGTQSQLFKISEITDQSARVNGGLSDVITGIGGEQACFALTARYSDGNETSLGEIVCIALVHTVPPQPGSELRPHNIAVDILDGNNALVSWDKPNTVVSSADATAIDRYDLYQGSASQVFKISEIEESGAGNTRRTTTVENVFEGSNCFALTATDLSQRQSALSTIVCGALPDANGSPLPSVPDGTTLGITNLTAQETSAGSVALGWDAPQLVAVGQPISNLGGYNLYQGSPTQLFKVAEIDHSPNNVRQQYQRTEVTAENSCFAATAYDRNGFESPLSEVVCVAVSGSLSLPQLGIVPPTELATSALGGSTTVTITWIASGTAATGSADPNVNHYNIYQGDHDRLFKVREIRDLQNGDPRFSSTFTGIDSGSACFAVTAQYLDLRESRLSDIVCRDD